MLFLATGAPASESRDFGPLSLTDLAGKKVSLVALRGKVVVLNFWATWCQPCVAEFPLLADIATRFSARGVVVVAASIDEADSRTDVARFAQRMPDGMELWVGASIEDMQRLGLGATIPVTVLLDRGGRVANMQRGSLEESSLDKAIAALLGGGGPGPRLGPKRGVPGVEEARYPEDRCELARNQVFGASL